MAKKPTYDELSQRVKGLENVVSEYQKQIHELKKPQGVDTDRKRAEEALRDNEAFLQSVFDGMRDGISVLDCDLNIIRVNAWMEKMYSGKMPLVGKKCYHAYQERESPCAQCPSILAMETGEAHTEIVPYPSVDETSGWIELSAFPLKESGGSATGVIEHVKDITPRMKAEKDLWEAQENYRNLIERANDGVIIVQDGKVEFCNTRLAEMFDCTVGEMINTPFLDYVLPDERSWIAEIHKRRLRGENVPDIYEMTALHKDGTRIDVEANSGLISYHGKPATFSFIRDITERKRAEEALLESEEKYRMLVENANEAIFVVQNSMIKFCNQRTIELSAYSEEELISRPFVDFIHPDDRELVLERHMKRLRGETLPETYPFRIIDKNGNTKWAEIGVVPISWEGSPATLCLLSDFTVRKIAEDELRKERDRAQMYLDIAGVMFLALDSNGDIVLINKKGCEILGYDEEEIRGKNWFDHFLPEKIGEEVKGVFKQLIKKNIEPAQYHVNPILTKNGVERYIAWTNTVLKNENGDIIGTFSSGEDITERKRSEEEKKKLESQLLQAQKMEAVGTLAGGIAHDFNNLLQAIMGYTQMLFIDVESNGLESDRLMQIEKSAQRASELTRQLLTFSRKVESNLRPLNLNQEVNQVERLLRRTIPRMIDIELGLEDNLKITNADPSQIEQVMMNLCINAMDAMPDGGKLTIETENVVLDDEYCKSHLGAVSGEYVLMSISDTGHGMDGEILEHIFEPFYTTKEKGKGTGLGLAMVYGIVKSHAGYIVCNSEPDRGTTFKLHFPVIEAESIVQGEENIAEEIPGGNETILLVDDEESLLDIGRKMLEHAGYRAITAENGERAVEVYEAYKDIIDLIILDVSMPGMGGNKCLRKLLEIDPNIKVIIATGYSADGEIREILQSGVAVFIGKPYRIEDMLNKVRDVLDN